MRKILLFSFCVMFVFSTHASTICADDDTIVIALSPNDKFIGGHGWNADGEWRLPYQNGTIYGAAACLDVDGVKYAAVPDLRGSDGELIVGGENQGVFCWCKITHPVQSQWIYRVEVTGDAPCLDTCANMCTGAMMGTPAMRINAYKSIILAQ